MYLFWWNDILLHYVDHVFICIFWSNKINFIHLWLLFSCIEILWAKYMDAGEHHYNWNDSQYHEWIGIIQHQFRSMLLLSSSNDNEAKLNQKMVNILWKTLYGNFCLKLIVVSSTESTYCPSISSPLERVPKISTFLYYYDDSVISLRKRSVGFWIPGGMSVIL